MTLPDRARKIVDLIRVGKPCGIWDKDAAEFEMAQMSVGEFENHLVAELESVRHETFEDAAKIAEDGEKIWMKYYDGESIGKAIAEAIRWKS